MSLPLASPPPPLSFQSLHMVPPKGGRKYAVLFGQLGLFMTQKNIFRLSSCLSRAVSQEFKCGRSVRGHRSRRSVFFGIGRQKVLLIDHFENGSWPKDEYNFLVIPSCNPTVVRDSMMTTRDGDAISIVASPPTVDHVIRTWTQLTKFE